MLVVFLVLHQYLPSLYTAYLLSVCSYPTLWIVLQSSICVTVERQDSLDSVEYHSQLEDNREEGDEEEEEMAMPTVNKKGSKKKRFSIFRKSSRRKSKDKGKNKLTVAAGLMHTLSVPEASPPFMRRTLSNHSNMSLSNESEGSAEHMETQSDQEFAETLMNPTPRASLLGAERRVGDDFGLRPLWEGRNIFPLPHCL